MGEGVLFQVKVTGSPPPKLVWYHNGEDVVADYYCLTMPPVEVQHTGSSVQDTKQDDDITSCNILGESNMLQKLSNINFYRIKFKYYKC